MFTYFHQCHKKGKPWKAHQEKRSSWSKHVENTKPQGLGMSKKYWCSIEALKRLGKWVPAFMYCICFGRQELTVHKSICWKLILHNQKLQKVLFVIYRSISLVVRSHPALTQLADLLGLILDQHEELQMNLTGYDGTLTQTHCFKAIPTLYYKISISNYSNVFIHLQ